MYMHIKRKSMSLAGNEVVLLPEDVEEPLKRNDFGVERNLGAVEGPANSANHCKPAASVMSKEVKYWRRASDQAGGDFFGQLVDRCSSEGSYCSPGFSRMLTHCPIERCCSGAHLDGFRVPVSGAHRLVRGIPAGTTRVPQRQGAAPLEAAPRGGPPFNLHRKNAAVDGASKSRLQLGRPETRLGFGVWAPSPRIWFGGGAPKNPTFLFLGPPAVLSSF